MHDEFGEEGGWRYGTRQLEAKPWRFTRLRKRWPATGAWPRRRCGPRSGEGRKLQDQCGSEVREGLGMASRGSESMATPVHRARVHDGRGKADDGGAAAAAGISTANSSPSLDGWPRFDGNVPWGTKMGRHVHGATQQR